MRRNYIESGLVSLVFLRYSVSQRRLVWAVAAAALTGGALLVAAGFPVEQRRKVLLVAFVVTCVILSFVIPGWRRH